MDDYFVKICSITTKFNKRGPMYKIKRNLMTNFKFTPNRTI